MMGESLATLTARVNELEMKSQGADADAAEEHERAQALAKLLDDARTQIVALEAGEVRQALNAPSAGHISHERWARIYRPPPPTTTTTPHPPLLEVAIEGAVVELNIRVKAVDEAKALANKGLEEIEILRQQLRLLQAGVAADSAELRGELAELRALLKEGMPEVALVSQRFNTPD